MMLVSRGSELSNMNQTIYEMIKKGIWDKLRTNLTDTLKYQRNFTRNNFTRHMQCRSNRVPLIYLAHN